MPTNITEIRSLLARGVNIHPLLMTVPPADPPVIPDGWEIAAPDFIGVGAQRSGTTWWWSVVHSHPDVAHATENASELPADQDPADQDLRVILAELYRKKELHFFDQYGQVEDIDPALYHRYFPRPPGSLAGEWTPRYMYDFWTPPMIRAVAPGTKILVILRDPVKRFSSGIAQSTRMARAMRAEFDADPFLYHEHFSRGLYWQQISYLLSHFPREQVLVLQYERCVADPVSQARRTFTFLGLDPDRWRLPEELTRQVGLATAPAKKLNAATKDAIRVAYQADVTQLLANFPELDGSLWPTVTG
jgi:Sulfotransferase family